MTIVKENEQTMLDVVEKAIQKHGDSRDELIPILTDVNRTLGYLPAEALEEISRKLKSPTFTIVLCGKFLSYVIYQTTW